MIKIPLSLFSPMSVLSKSPDFRLIRLTRNSIHHLANSFLNAKKYLCEYFGWAQNPISIKVSWRGRWKWYRLIRQTRCFHLKRPDNLNLASFPFKLSKILSLVYSDFTMAEQPAKLLYLVVQAASSPLILCLMWYLSIPFICLYNLNSSISLDK